MIQITERDQLLLGALAARGWCSVKYLTQFFPSHQATLQRLKTLEEYGIIERRNIMALINENNLHHKTLMLCNYYTNKSYFVKITREAYGKTKIKNKTLLKESLVIHQLYQEFIEVHFKTEFGVQKIESNPDYKPRPDLFFEHNSKKYVIEIERRVRKPKVSNHRDKSYQDYIDSLLMYCDRIIYFFETEDEHKKFIKESYSKRVFSSVINKPDVLIDHEKNKILTKDLLSG